MLRLIKAQTYVLFKTRTFKVLCIVAILMGLMLGGIAKLMSSEGFIRGALSQEGMSVEQQDEYIKTIQNSNDEDTGKVKPKSQIGVSVSAKDIFNPTAKELFHSSFGSGIMEIFMAVLIGLMVASEYSSGTIKNVLAYGKKREHYYISKLVACTIGFTIILGIMVSIGTIFSSLLFGWGEPFTITQAAQIIEVFAGAIVIGMGIISVLMLLATVVKSNGSTIGIGIVILGVLPSIISLLYGNYDWFDRIYECSLSYNWTLLTSASSDNCDILKAVVVGLVTSVIATAGGITIFKKQDIK